MAGCVFIARRRTRPCQKPAVGRNKNLEVGLDDKSAQNKKTLCQMTEESSGVAENFAELELSSGAGKCLIHFGIPKSGENF